LYFTFAAIKFALLQRQLFDLVTDLVQKTFEMLRYLGVRPPQCLDLVALMLAMDHTFGTDRWAVACEAEVLHALFRMLGAGNSLRRQWLDKL